MLAMDFKCLILLPLFTSLSWSAAIPSQRVLSEVFKDVKTVTTRCDCTGTNDTGNSAYICGDPRLGPVELPSKFPLLAVVNDYDRFGGLQPGEFLEKWWDKTANSYIYPAKDGYLLDVAGNPIKGNATLPIGTKLDRFGSEYGKYVAEAEAPYDQRALPPWNLNTDVNNPEYPDNYHVYVVIKPLTVEAGPVAPWFGQAGLGAQFYTGYTGNILYLLKEEYIAPLKKSVLDPPGESGGKCG